MKDGMNYRMRNFWNAPAIRGCSLSPMTLNTMPAAACTRMEQGQRMAGLLMVPQSAPVSSVIESLVLIWHASEAEEWANLVVFLPLA
jgi:hypothetical protein